jgi:hypothetical protein
LIAWSADGRGRLVDGGVLDSRLDDPELLSWLSREDVAKVAIDCPLGWPRAWRRALASWACNDEWPHAPIESSDPLMKRMTDRVTAARVGHPRYQELGLGLPLERALAGAAGSACMADPDDAPRCPEPISVCAEKLGRTAARAAWLLSQMAEAGFDVSRDGSGRVLEVYPAAALWLWGVARGPYGKETPDHRERRRRMVACLRERAEGLLDIPDVSEVAVSPHRVDALVAALLARAAHLRPPSIPAKHDQIAREEGWIYLPETLGGLAGALTPA